jgi:outer membrane autotransporter protein
VTGDSGVSGEAGQNGTAGIVAGVDGQAGKNGQIGTSAGNGADGDAGQSGLAGAKGGAGNVGLAGSDGSHGFAGSGGVAVTGAGNTRVINDGTIAGGWSGDGLIQANAIEFAGGGNVLEIHSNSVIEGKAIATRSAGEAADFFELGGDADGTFDAGEIGTRYIGFSQYTKTGMSTWILTGTTNEITSWTLYDGILSVSQDGRLGNIAGGLTFDGGTLQITGHEFAATSRGITLESGGGGFDITDLDHVFTLNQTITGVGGLTKSGDGTLVLNGVNQYDGLTEVSEGTLIIGGDAAHHSAIVSGDAIVRNGANLGGHGAVGGDLVNSGRVSPASPLDDISVFTVHGNYTQTAEGTLQIDADPELAIADKLIVGGIATLDGTLLVNPLNDTAWHMKQVVVDAAGGVTGTFDEVVDHSESLDTIAGYDAHTAYIDIYRNNVVFSEVEDLTENQGSVASALDQLPKDGSIVRAVLENGEDKAGQSFDSLSGELHGSVASALIGAERVTRLVMSGNIRNRIQEAGDDTIISDVGFGENYRFTSSKSGMVQEETGPVTTGRPDSRRFGLWGEVVADDLTLEGDGNAATTEQNLAGIYVGANIMLGGGWQSGLAYGHTEGDINVRDRDSSAEIENNVLAATIGKSWRSGDNAINFFLGGSYTRSGVETERNVSVGSIRETLTADYDVDTFQLFTEIGYEMKMGRRGFLEPFLGLGYSSLSGSSYQEEGGTAALSGDGIEADQFNTTLGLRFRQGFDLGPLPAWFRVSAGWQHTFGDAEGVAVNSFNSGGPFSVKGAPLDRDAAVIDLGLGVNVTESLSIGASYDGRFSENNTENTYRLNLNWKF